MSILIDKLRSFEYYKNKLPLYLQNSYGIVEQYKIWHDLLINVVDSSDKVLSMLNIFDSNYLTTLPDKSDMLDNIGLLFGVTRNMLVTYYDEESILHENEALELNNEELLMLIKAQIIRAYYDGSRSEIIKLYNEILNLPIVYLTNDSISAKCTIYLAEIPGSEVTYSDNIKKLFLAGQLNLESLGIEYSFGIIDLNNTLVWDKPISLAYTGWDGGKWGL